MKSWWENNLSLIQSPSPRDMRKKKKHKTAQPSHRHTHRAKLRGYQQETRDVIKQMIEVTQRRDEEPVRSKLNGGHERSGQLSKS
ncbi:hypothetical protein CBG18_00380, partial [Limosilactobacillus reuteri]|uniref:hypothetical protein n=1 Tax=Limosilactobacillus reuteri TaxID=1598 RepID=UPI000BD35E21